MPKLPLTTCALASSSAFRWNCCRPRFTWNDDDGSAGVPELVLEGDLAEMDAGEETCNAPTEEEAITLEEAAAAVKTIGRFLVVSGMALSGTKGALSVERITAEEAKFKVKAIESDYFAFMTLDANPERYPKLLCNRGFPLIRSPRSAQPKHPASAHIWKPEGSLPTSEEATLFVDGHRLQRAGATLPPRRPGRGEGLADEFGGDLCLFGDHITPHDLRQGGLGNCCKKQSTKRTPLCRHIIKPNLRLHPIYHARRTNNTQGSFQHFRPLPSFRKK